MTASEYFKELGIRVKKERDDYRASSVLYKLRERARSLKSKKARENAWSIFYSAFKQAFPEGSLVWIDESVHFDTENAGGFATYKPMQVRVSYNLDHRIVLEGLTYDRVEIGYDPCGHDNLMGLELAQIGNK